jgi:hyperosmotically inducible protein
VNLNISKQIKTTARFGAAIALALGLAACNQQQPAEKLGRNVDRPAERAGQQTGQAADTAHQQIDQTKTAVGEKAAEASKTLDDATVTAKVKSALITEPGVKALEINVDTTDGIVTLHGTTDTLANRDKATRLAAGVEGVKSVTNNLKIISGS